jgi:hypothetical protein
VIDNVVCTDSWISIVRVGCGLIGVGAGDEQARKFDVSGPSGVEQTSSLGSRDPVANRIKCGPHSGKNSKVKSCMVSWLSLKTKIESGQPWWPSHDWRLAGGHTKSAGFPVVHHKTTGFPG